MKRDGKKSEPEVGEEYDQSLVLGYDIMSLLPTEDQDSTGCINISLLGGRGFHGVPLLFERLLGVNELPGEWKEFFLGKLAKLK